MLFLGFFLCVFSFLVENAGVRRRPERTSQPGLERGAEQGRHSADIRGAQREIDDLRAVGRKERIGRGILTNKLLLSRKGSGVCACPCVSLSYGVARASLAQAPVHAAERRESRSRRVAVFRTFV